MRDQYLQIKQDAEQQHCKAKNDTEYYKTRVQLIVTEDGDPRMMVTRTLCLDKKYPAGKYVVPFRSLRLEGRNIDFDFPVTLEPVTASK